MNKAPVALAIAGLMACDGSLAKLWEPPPGRQVKTVPSVKVISGRIAALTSETTPRQVAPTLDERINVIDHVGLGNNVWIVRTRIPLLNSKRELRLAGGEILTDQQLSRLLDAAPRQVLGLTLDETLTFLRDQKGLGRTGRVVGCDGDPIDSALALRACLALAFDRGQPILSFDKPTVPKMPTILPDSGPPLVDRSITTDAGVSKRFDGGELR